MYASINAPTAARAAKALVFLRLWRLVELGWSISKMHELHHRNASVTSPPTCSSSAAQIFGTPGMPQRRQRKRVLVMARPCRTVFLSRLSHCVAKQREQ